VQRETQWQVGGRLAFFLSNWKNISWTCVSTRQWWVSSWNTESYTLRLKSFRYSGRTWQEYSYVKSGGRFTLKRCHYPSQKPLRSFISTVFLVLKPDGSCALRMLSPSPLNQIAFQMQSVTEQVCSNRNFKMELIKSVKKVF